MDPEGDGPGRRSTAPEPEPAPGASGNRLEEQWRALQGDLLGIFAGTKRALAIEGRRVALTAFDGLFYAILFCVLATFVLAASVAAALLVVQGTSGALAAWSGREWVGDLSTGVLFFVALVSGSLAIRHRIRRGLVERARKIACGAE